MTGARGAPAAKPGRTLVFVGTGKGLFAFASDDRRHWERYGPYLAGTAVPTALLETGTDRPRLFAPAGDAFWGIKVHYSDDLGASWSEAEVNPRFPEDAGVSLRAIWSLAQAPGGRLYAGVEPAALFTSDDRGRTWELLPGLWNHPHRPKWEPGGGGLCLHTIVFDPSEPRRVYVAISTGGVYRSEDSGDSWQPRNQGIIAGFQPDKYPEFGQCVHKLALAAGRPERLYLQNHGGVYRSDDRAETWVAKEQGLPGNFGFALAAHPHDPGTAYVIPLDDRDHMPRWTHDGRVAVYRTRDGGESWQPLREGLPQAHAYLTVLRDGMATDGGDPAGIYFGTRSGHVFYSADEGDHWSLLAEMLPPVLAVKAYRL